MAKTKTEKKKLGKIDIADRLNAKLGKKISFNLKESNPTEVTQWIPTGSRWLDSIISRGNYAGIPCGKVVEIAGLSACVTEDTLVEIINQSITQIVPIKDIKRLLEEGKKVKVKTIDNEFTEVVDYIEKGVLPTYRVRLENGNQIKVSGQHRFFTNCGWLTTFDLVVEEHQLLCDDNQYSLVKEVSLIGEYPIVDITVDHKEQCYFGNGILNHNTGKSYLACQISANAQKMGFPVVYFDSEMAMDPSFLERSGVDLDTFHYTQAVTLEDVLEMIEDVVFNTEQPTVFILDSYPLTPTRAGKVAEEIDSRRDIAEKPRILAEAFSRLLIPLANHQSTFIILNQLKTKIPGRNKADQVDAMINPYYAPGGKTMDYPLSLRIWLTRRKSKDAFVYDDNGFKIGSEVKCKLEKSRFGTEGRVCTFKILWAVDEPGVQDEESWMEALRSSEYLTLGSWCMLFDDDGVQIGKSFRSKDFKSFLDETEGARERIYELMDREVIQKFDKREGNASNFYRLSDDGEPVEVDDSGVDDES